MGALEEYERTEMMVVGMGFDSTWVHFVTSKQVNAICEGDGVGI
jgi:hypothetical protein